MSRDIEDVFDDSLFDLELIIQIPNPAIAIIIIATIKATIFLFIIFPSFFLFLYYL